METATQNALRRLLRLTGILWLFGLLGMRRKYVLLDCDDTIVLTEEPAFQACATVVNKMLTSKGVDFAFTGASLMHRFVGYSFRRIAQDLAAEHNFAFGKIEVRADNVAALQELYGVEMTPGSSFDELDFLVKLEEDAVIAKLAKDVKPTQGVEAAIAWLHANYGVAVVSSSALRRVIACLQAVGVAKFFGEKVFSAASLAVPSSKPDPAVYLHALRVLAVAARNCVAVEDSRTGVLAAVAAGIPVLGYVGALAPEAQAERSRVLREAGAFAVISEWTQLKGVLTSHFEKA
jgi:HAD superfamily hydrolase (TIGR01509 family)